MNEIETKILDTGPEILDALGEDILGERFFKVFEGNIDAIYFENSDIDVEMVRLRTLNEMWAPNIHELTVKTIPKAGEEDEKFKHLWEVNILVDDSMKTERFLRLLGFSEKYRITKKRTSYILPNGSRLEFDSLSNGRKWLEIESPTECILNDTLTLLGYSKNDTTNITTEEIAHADC